MLANIYQLPEHLPNQELFESIISNSNLLLERIISTGQITPTEEWLQQEKDEWVILLQGKAELSFFDGTKVELNPGDYILIKSQQKHRVDYTSTQPPCIWLALHTII